MTAKLSRSSFFKVIRMSTERLYLIVLFLLVGCQQAGIGQDEPTQPAESTIAKAELDEQLEINREALLKGPGEQIRIKAATVMLSDTNPVARGILLNALRQSENSAARMAVCKALSQTRASRRPISNKEDFIQPLCEILITENSATAKLAAEATLIFEYEQISQPLEKMVTDASLPPKARLNAIGALKRPDIGAMSRLIKLVDDSEKEVAAGAEKALRSLGIPIGKDAATRERIIEELKRKGRDEFLRDWLVRQEAELRKLEIELDWWKKQYLDALDKIYDGISEDQAKGGFLAERLADAEVTVRLWALEKVERWRLGTNPELPAELKPVLISLISDENRSVRLKTAKLLSLMGELNSAEKLVEQHEIEEDNEVRTEIFVAFGVSLSNSSGPEIRKKALELAATYLYETDVRKAQEGAEVIKKQLEQNELTPEEVGKYLSLLVERYKQEESGGNGVLRGGLLSAMAGLCAQQSACKVESAGLFGPLFGESLDDKTDSVRKAAVDGLIYINKTRALIRFRKGGLVNDPSIEVRKTLVNLAGEVGGKDDLVWLWEKIGSTAESDPVWEAMLRIFRRSEADVLAEWIREFDQPRSKDKLSDVQKLPVLETAEQKAVGENKAKMLKSIREKLAELYSKTGDFKRAAEYFGTLHAAAATGQEKEAVSDKLLEVYLRWPNVKAAAQLVNNHLLEKDLDPNCAVVVLIDNYFAKPPAGTDPEAMLEALTKIDNPDDRPKWLGQLRRWAERLGSDSAKGKGPDKAE